MGSEMCIRDRLESEDNAFDKLFGELKTEAESAEETAQAEA